MIPVCPKCDVSLFVLHFQEMEIDSCHQCRGLWVDGSELELLMKQAEGKDRELLARLQTTEGKVPPGRKHLCPRCDEPLQEIVPFAADQNPLTLDRCPRGHGGWFDGGEVEQFLAVFPPQSGIRLTGVIRDLLGLNKKGEAI